MKLLLDENLSYRLVGMLADVISGIVHVRDLGLQNVNTLPSFKALIFTRQYFDLIFEILSNADTWSSKVAVGARGMG